jgi:putative effector of murein hydrolase
MVDEEQEIRLIWPFYYLFTCDLVEKTHDNLIYVKTLEYYSRSCIYISITFILLAILEYYTRFQADLHAMHAILLYLIFLCVLIFMKLYKPIDYERLKLFCTPGNVFLKSWTPLFFFVYLVQLPIYLMDVAPEFIISWLLQDILGNIFSTWLTAAFLTFVFTFMGEDDVDDDKDKDNKDNGKNDPEEVGEEERESVVVRDSVIAKKRIDDLDWSSEKKQKLKDLQREALLEELTSSWRSSKAFEAQKRAQRQKLNLEFSYLGDANVEKFANTAKNVRQSLSEEDNIPLVMDADDFGRSGLNVSVYDANLYSSLSVKEASALKKEEATTLYDAHYIKINNLKENQAKDVSVEGERASFNNLRDGINNLGVRKRSVSAASAKENKYISDHAITVPIKKKSLIMNDNPLHTVDEGDEDASTVITNNNIEMSEKKKGVTFADENEEEEEDDDDDEIGENKEEEHPPVLPYIPTMSQLYDFWLRFMLFIALLITFYSRHRALITLFQMGASIWLYIGCSHYRTYILDFLRIKNSYAREFLQAPILMVPVLAAFVIFSGRYTFHNAQGNLLDYKVALPVENILEWGAGNLCSCLLPVVIVGMAWSTCDAVLAFQKLLPLLFPAITLVVFVLLIFGVGIATLTCTPIELSTALMTRSLTTPVALAVAPLTTASPQLIAATNVFNGILSLKTAVMQMDYWGFKNPVARGCAGGVGGTLLGVVAFEQAGEQLACGIGMAGYGIATVMFCIIIIIQPLKEELLNIADANICT